MSDVILGEIVTSGFDHWYVRRRAPDGSPLEVEHAEPSLRGSSLEARLNVSLAVRHFKGAVREACPAWLKRHIPQPRRWWIETSEEIGWPPLPRPLPPPPEPPRNTAV